MLAIVSSNSKHVGFVLGALTNATQKTLKQYQKIPVLHFKNSKICGGAA